MINASGIVKGDCSAIMSEQQLLWSRRIFSCNSFAWKLCNQTNFRRYLDYEPHYRSNRLGRYQGPFPQNTELQSANGRFEQAVAGMANSGLTQNAKNWLMVQPMRCTKVPYTQMRGPQCCWLSQANQVRPWWSLLAHGYLPLAGGTGPMDEYLIAGLDEINHAPSCLTAGMWKPWITSKVIMGSVVKQRTKLTPHRLRDQRPELIFRCCAGRISECWRAC